MTDVNRVIDFVFVAVKDYDESHGLNHALLVMGHTLSIISLMEGTTLIDGWPNEKSKRIIMFAALLHDVCDGKFCNDTQSGYEKIRKELKNYCSLDEIDVVIDIIDNVSFSKEKDKQDKGTWNTWREGLDKKRITLARDIVSDADKITALGRSGIERCIQYNRYKFGKSSVVINEEDLKNMCKRAALEHCHEKLSLLHPYYIRTPGGKQLSIAGHKTILEFMDRHKHLRDPKTVKK